LKRGAPRAWWAVYDKAHHFEVYHRRADCRLGLKSET